MHTMYMCESVLLNTPKTDCDDFVGFTRQILDWIGFVSQTVNAPNYKVNKDGPTFKWWRSDTTVKMPIQNSWNQNRGVSYIRWMGHLIQSVVFPASYDSSTSSGFAFLFIFSFHPKLIPSNSYFTKNVYRFFQVVDFKFPNMNEIRSPLMSDYDEFHQRMNEIVAEKSPTVSWKDAWWKQRELCSQSCAIELSPQKQFNSNETHKY